MAKATQDMKSRGGEVIVAKDTKMMGKVTEAQPRTKDQKESQVAIGLRPRGAERWQCDEPADVNPGDYRTGEQLGTK